MFLQAVWGGGVAVQNPPGAGVRRRRRTLQPHQQWRETQGRRCSVCLRPIAVGSVLPGEKCALCGLYFDLITFFFIFCNSLWWVGEREGSGWGSTAGLISYLLPHRASHIGLRRLLAMGPGIPSSVMSFQESIRQNGLQCLIVPLLIMLN